MNAIFEESTTKEEPVENKEEYLANLLRTREVVRFAGELKDRKKSANTGDRFEHQLVVALKWQIMKKNEDQ